MKTILVISFTLSPNRGSEFSVGWNYITEMSRNNKLIVLIGKSTPVIMNDFSEVQDYIDGKKEIKNVTFVPVSFSKKTINIVRFFSKIDFLPLNYFIIEQWHKLAYRESKKIISQQKVDVVHLLTLTGFREPGYCYRLDCPYIWGPTNGLNYVNPILYTVLPLKNKIMFYVRYLSLNFMLNFSHKIKQAVRNCDVLISGTTEGQTKLNQLYGREVAYLPENGAFTVKNNRAFDRDMNAPQINIISVGALSGGKAHIIALRALNQIKNKDKVKYQIVGSGDQEARLKAYVSLHKMEDMVTFYGNIPRKAVYNMFSNAHLHLLTSVSEANTTVILEAMECGVPTITLDHAGMHDTITADNGVKVPIKGSVDEVVAYIATAIDDLVENRQMLQHLSEGAFKSVDLYSWDKRICFFERQYDIAMENYLKKKNNN